MFEQFIEERNILDELWFAQREHDMEMYSYMKNLALPPLE